MIMLGKSILQIWVNCIFAEEEIVDFVAPAISADLTPELVIEEKTEKKEKRRTSLIEQKIKTDTKGKKWGKPKKDTSYEDELRRQEIAEERRRRQMEMLERLKGRQMEQFEGQEDDGSPHFEDCKISYVNISWCFTECLTAVKMIMFR